MSFTWSVEYDLLPSITSFWSLLRACSWLCSSLTRCGSALFMPAVGYALFTSCRSALLPAVGPLFWFLFIRIIHLFTFTQASSLSCVRSPASLFCECVSLAPRAPYTPSFAVWCLGLSRACAVLLRSSWHSMSRSRSSWHSMSRSPWHFMVFQRRCPRADPRVLFRTLLHVLRVWRALTSGWS